MTEQDATMADDELFDDDPEDDNLPLRELTRLRGGQCRDCQAGYSDPEALYSIALGFKNAPRCLACLSRRLGRDSDELQAHLQQYIHKRDCYLRAWETIRSAKPLMADLAEGGSSQAEADQAVVADVAERWDAGGLGCGELVMELRIRLKKLPPGSVYELIARDAAAPEDIPAWCRLCGHTLLKANHPTYWIRRSGA